MFCPARLTFTEGGEYYTYTTPPKTGVRDESTHMTATLSTKIKRHKHHRHGTALHWIVPRKKATRSILYRSEINFTFQFQKMTVQFKFVYDL